jgi:hypothetical protein
MHTPSAVGVLIGHMLFTHFSIYPYLKLFVRKMRSNGDLLRQIIFPSLNKKRPAIRDRGPRVCYRRLRLG